MARVELSAGRQPPHLVGPACGPLCADPRVWTTTSGDPVGRGGCLGRSWEREVVPCRAVG